MKVLVNSQKRPHLYAPPIVLLLIVSVINDSNAANYIINPNSTNISFAIERFKTSATTGGFYNVKGQLQYEPISKSGSILLIIPISSLDTGNTIFNENLKGASFFDMQRFPSARFQSTKWYFNNTGSSEVIKVDGNLTLHGETHPISLIANKFNCYQNSIAKKRVCKGNFTTTIDRTKWNINKYSLFGLTNNLDLKVQIEAMEQ